MLDEYIARKAEHEGLPTLPTNAAIRLNISVN